MTERDLFLAKAEVQRRVREAAEERRARREQREAEESRAADEHDPAAPRGAFSWLRRLARAR